MTWTRGARAQIGAGVGVLDAGEKVDTATPGVDLAVDPLDHRVIDEFLGSDAPDDARWFAAIASGLKQAGKIEVAQMKSDLESIGVDQAGDFVADTHTLADRGLRVGVDHEAVEGRCQTGQGKVALGPAHGNPVAGDDSPLLLPPGAQTSDRLAPCDHALLVFAERHAGVVERLFRADRGSVQFFLALEIPLRQGDQFLVPFEKLGFGHQIGVDFGELAPGLEELGLLLVDGGLVIEGVDGDDQIAYGERAPVDETGADLDDATANPRVSAPPRGRRRFRREPGSRAVRHQISPSPRPPSRPVRETVRTAFAAVSPASTRPRAGRWPELPGARQRG